jgi:hypothetical protein
MKNKLKIHSQNNSKIQWKILRNRDQSNAHNTHINVLILSQLKMFISHPHTLMFQLQRTMRPCDRLPGTHRYHCTLIEQALAKQEQLTKNQVDLIVSLCFDWIFMHHASRKC